ncbi:class I adenylate-forming enzyme family protein [Enterococcus ureasiticus]|uniref:Long-chain fatty acid--CoA ligase n=1 Tax=Enterococcus ureasiticus TaxID=903984 RepID=A0A1E5GCD8_9ENTE|nr:class I adenylate-forming enzyme family protein [Enterococcus ureasiticus]OEG10339.1 hypothetical protein BCR21_13400 [Enterococcus ureasiticus]
MDKIKNMLQERCDSTKILTKDSSGMITYAEAHNFAKKMATLINGCNVGKSALLLVKNSNNYVLGYFSLLYADKVIVPIYYESTPTEVESVLSYCESNFIVCDCSSEKFLRNILKDIQYSVTLLNIETTQIINLNSQLRNIVNSIQFEKQLEDVVLLLQTSGTTSSPKRVMLTNKNLISNVIMHTSSVNLCETDVSLIILPSCFGYVNTAQLLSTIYVGGTVVYYDGLLHLKRLINVINQHNITNFTCVPQIVKIFNELNTEKTSLLKSLRFVNFGGAALRKDDLNMLMSKLKGVQLIQTYGQTEASPRLTSHCFSKENPMSNNIGKPLDGVQMKVVDKDFKELPTREVGEIVTRGSNVMKGYFKDIDKTKAKIRNGWLHTEDLGYKTEEGDFFFLGRIKNIIICNGLNIFPEDIEDVIATFPGIKDCIVIGEEDASAGEVPVAKYSSVTEIDSQKLREYCYQFLSKYKIPRKFIRVKSVRKTYNGKKIRE